MWRSEVGGGGPNRVRDVHYRSDGTRDRSTTCFYNVILGMMYNRLPSRGSLRNVHLAVLGPALLHHDLADALHDGNRLLALLLGNIKAWQYPDAVGSGRQKQDAALAAEFDEAARH